MRKKSFTLASLRKSSEANAQACVFEKKLPRRRGICCLCRCDPKQGIVALHPDYARGVYEDQMHYILDCDNPGHIADRAIQVGKILSACGRPLLAQKLMRAALMHLISEDDNQQEDYALNHHYPGLQYEQWYQYWSERVSEVDARRLAAHIDELEDEIRQRLGCNERSRLRFWVHDRYEGMFHWIYEC